MERSEHSLSYREAAALDEKTTIERFVNLRRICEQVFPEVGLEREDINKVFKDAQGDLGDVIGSVYGHLLEAGEDPDERLEGLGVYESLE